MNADPPMSAAPPGEEGGRCATLLLEALRGNGGVTAVEFLPSEGALRVRYDPALIPGPHAHQLARSLGQSLEAEVAGCQWALGGVRCRDCATAVERAVAGIPGVRGMEAHPPGVMLGFEVDRALTSATGSERHVAHRLRTFGSAAGADARSRLSWAANPMTLGAAGCGLFTLAAAITRAAHAPADLTVGLFAAAYVTGGAQGLVEAWASLRKRIFDVNFLMLLAAAGAASIGAWQEGSVLLFLFSLSNALQFFALERTRHAIQALMRLRPDVAVVVVDGREVAVPAAELRRGDRVRVRPGERLAADGTLVEGTTHVDESAMTGEAIPVGKQAGSPVYAGTINAEGAFEFEVTREANQTRLARIIELVEKAQGEKAPTQAFIDRFGQYYALAILAAVGAALALLPLLFRWHFHDAFYRAMVTLVVASPCALVISTPASVLSAIAAAARRGILFKGGGYLETVGKLRTVALDKTGTLTVGRPTLTDVVPAPGCEAAELMELAMAAESRSDHPLARAITGARRDGSRRDGSRRDGARAAEATEARAHLGLGVEAMVRGCCVRVGSRRFLEQYGVALPEVLLAEQRRLEEAGRTVVLAAADRRALGLLAVADEPREDAAAALAALRAQGIERVVMLSGDHAVAAQAIACRLGVDEVHAGLLPEDKVRVLQELRRRHGPVAMVGDGVNDAPALAAADLGVAMGGRGTDVALETADVVLVSDSLARLPEMVMLGRRASRVVRQNVFLSVGVMAALVAFNFFGHITLPVGVLGHEGSTLLVVLNGLRLLRGAGPRRSSETQQRGAPHGGQPRDCSPSDDPRGGRVRREAP